MMYCMVKNSIHVGFHQSFAYVGAFALGHEGCHACFEIHRHDVLAALLAGGDVLLALKAHRPDPSVVMDRPAFRTAVMNASSALTSLSPCPMSVPPSVVMIAP